MLRMVGQFERTPIINEEKAFSMHYVVLLAQPPQSLQQQITAFCNVRRRRNHCQERPALPLHDNPELEHRCL